MVADRRLLAASASRDETMESFVLAFQKLGYVSCNDDALESDFEKVAIYVDQSNTPTHMARQLLDGTWTSKCGSLEDIEHEKLEALSGFDFSEYGVPVKFLKRAIQASAINET